MMQVWSDFGKWIINAILKPLFGTWWAEITAIIICVLFIAAAFTVGYFMIKLNKKYNDEKKEKDGILKSNAELFNQKKDLEASLEFVRKDVEKEKALTLSLKAELEQKTLELEEMKKTKISVESEQIIESAIPNETVEVAAIETTNITKKASKGKRKNKEKKK